MSDASLPSPFGAAHPMASSGGGLPHRRSFFVWFLAALAAVPGLLAGFPVVRYFFTPRRKTVDWVSLGSVDRFTIGETQLATGDDLPGQPSDALAADATVYVRRQEPGEDGSPTFLVLAVRCTHVGCTVDWVPQSSCFKCPCHGGVFRADGSRLSGPPQRGLFRCVWRTRDNLLEIRPLRPSMMEDAQLDASRCE